LTNVVETADDSLHSWSFSGLILGHLCDKGFQEFESIHRLDKVGPDHVPNIINVCRKRIMRTLILLKLRDRMVAPPRYDLLEAKEMSNHI